MQNDKVLKYVYDPNTPDYALLTTEEVCSLFNVCDSTLWRWRASGKFPEPAKLPGKGCRYSVGSVRNFLSQLGIAA